MKLTEQQRHWLRIRGLPGSLKDFFGIVAVILIGLLVLLYFILISVAAQYGDYYS